jgi:hypothetical protein
MMGVSVQEKILPFAAFPSSTCRDKHFFGISDWQAALNLNGRFFKPAS